MEQRTDQKRSRGQAEADFLPQLERGSRISLEKQLVRAIREAIESGRLHPGMRLPSSRRLAALLHFCKRQVGCRMDHSRHICFSSCFIPSIPCFLTSRMAG